MMCLILLTLVFHNCQIPNHINETLKALIPKREMRETIKQFRPISLCNNNYKIISKITANRIKPFLPKRIPRNQNSFLQGRGAETNVSITSEILKSMLYRKGNRVRVMYILDQEKAYNKLK